MEKNYFACYQDALIDANHAYLIFGVAMPQCGKFRNLLSFRFYMKSISENLEVVKLPFFAILGVKKFVNFVNLSLQKVKNFVKIKIQRH